MISQVTLNGEKCGVRNAETGIKAGKEDGVVCGLHVWCQCYTDIEGNNNSGSTVI